MFAIKGAFMKTMLILLLTCMAAISQTSDTFRQKYGAPVSESYLVRPGILAIMNYAKNGKVCSIYVTAQTNPKFTKGNITPIDNKVLWKIVGELVPDSQRGKLLKSGFLNLTCVGCESFYGSEESYEKVYIRIGGSSNENQTASIRWNGISCER
jgi:hypothetical protein